MPSIIAYAFAAAAAAIAHTPACTPPSFSRFAIIFADYAEIDVIVLLIDAFRCHIC